MIDHLALSRRRFIQATAAASAWLAAPGAMGRVLGANERLNLAKQLPAHQQSFRFFFRH